ncbi:helix-turn-helix transcriptional regulator [Streptomyces chartreusis]|uniref:helix-turn-helix domain-containing protein n=1 Tax=Streptomyces chartreusis TaxID=1969 RepID=UPI002F912FA7|nr:helix-turn-helix transcriptional regulator [Streptomyces chartreusis]WTA33577.1 helix-turn-helix transcriptional regulator [Streptomyces chartreusis]
MDQIQLLSELGAFLKCRRAELSPHLVGLPDSAGPRRVAGLRREEVAQLASISTDYYARLEQGRMTASAPVLEAVARALRLDDDQRRYVFGLAGKETDRSPSQVPQRVQPQLRRVLDDLTSIPAMVLGRCLDVIAWNSLGAALITDFAAVPYEHRNYVRILFTDPLMRTLHADWTGAARAAVAQLRMESVKTPNDASLTALVEELSSQDQNFCSWWSAHHVAALRVGTKLLNHPIVGELSLDWDTLTASTDLDQQLIVWTAKEDSLTHERLRILASWAAEHHHSAGGLPPNPVSVA